jgi:hypothetical protein
MVFQLIKLLENFFLTPLFPKRPPQKKQFLTYKNIIINIIINLTMKLVDKKISLLELKQMAKKMYSDLVKAVVDIEKEIMVVDGEMHADEEQLLLAKGSKQENLWGINLYPDLFDKNFIEFDSVINLRPRLNNFSRFVEDEKIRKKIIEIVNKLVKK